MPGLMPDIVGPLIGGAFIGIAAGGLLYLKGKTAGVSGVVEGVVRLEKGELGWKLAFIGGLLAGGLLMKLLRPESFSTPHGPIWLAVVAGLLVGFGTRLGNGCTSGHGVCGISRFSARSLVATATFLVTGALAVALFGGAS